MERLRKNGGQIAEATFLRRVVKEIPSQDISTLHRLDCMFARRGLALEAARLMSFEAHQKIADRLFRALEDEPADAARFESTSLAQAAKADEEIFLLLSRRVVGAIARRADGSYPLEVPLQGILDDARVQQILSHLPRRATPAPPNPKIPKPNPPPPAPPKAGANKADPAGGDKKGKGKGKKKSTPRMPAELVGMAYQNAKGQHLCFNFNLGGCGDAGPGEVCPRGSHQCCKLLADGSACLQSHSQRDHP